MLLLLGIAAVRHAFRAAACRWAMGADRGRFSYPAMFGLLLASESVKFAAFAGLVFGESIKGTLLSRRVSTARAVSSVLLDVLLYQLSAAVFLLAGALLLAWKAPAALRRDLEILAGVVAVGLALVAFGFAREFRTTRRLLGAPFKSGSSPVTTSGTGPVGQAFLPVRPARLWLEKHGEKLSEAGDQVFGFHRQHPWLFWGVLAWDMMAHCLSALEVMVALHLLGPLVGWREAVGIEALTKLLRLPGAVVPANLGVFEGGTAVIVVALGLPAAAGVALGIIRQLRSLLWAALGFLVLFWWTRSPAGAKA